MMPFNIWDYSIRRTCFTFYEKHSKHQSKTVIKMMRHPGGGTSRRSSRSCNNYHCSCGDKYLNILEESR